MPEQFEARVLTDREPIELGVEHAMVQMFVAALDYELARRGETPLAGECHYEIDPHLTEREHLAIRVTRFAGEGQVQTALFTAGQDRHTGIHYLFAHKPGTDYDYPYELSGNTAEIVFLLNRLAHMRSQQAPPATD